jgi:hypothetical protein
MALISPNGMATIIAITAPMKKVPQNSGTAPSDLPGSAASITCGLQCVPNRKSVIGTC